MKKRVGFIAVILGAMLCAKLHAATPLDQPYQGSGPYQNTSIYVSTYALSGGDITLSFAALSSRASVSGRNCITNVVGSLSTGSTAYFLDGGTTFYYVFGNTVGPLTGGAQGNFLQINRDHLGPFCGTGGNAMTFSVPHPYAATLTNAITVEGFTYYAPSLNGGQ